MSMYIYVCVCVYPFGGLKYLEISFSSVAPSCPALCDPMDYTVHGILQARILEWVAFPFSSGWNLSNPGIKPRSPPLPADSLTAELQGKLCP